MQFGDLISRQHLVHRILFNELAAQSLIALEPIAAERISFVRVIVQPSGISYLHYSQVSLLTLIQLTF